MKKNNGERLRISIILRMIMSTGTAVILVGTTHMLLCPVQEPIYLDMCVKATGSVFDALSKAGIIPQTIAVIGGISAYWLSGKWVHN